jgi:tetrapyrrole methylase family protein/MazG family protein
MYTFDDLVGIIAKLRSPEGCPWDREQTFESLKKCLSDETQEVFQAIDNDDMENLCEELGDVLLQVILNSQIAKEAGLLSTM